MSKKTFYIIDGSSYIFRAFYGLPLLTNQKGIPTNAVYGFVTMIQRLFKEKKPDYWVITFDRPEPSFRKEIFPDYKAHRAIPPDELKVQFPYIEKATEVFNFPSLYKDGFEADDVMGTLAREYASKDLQIYLVTGDKDMMQLVNEDILIYDSMKDKLIDHAGVKEKFGVEPNKVIDLLALAGDSSDNIPGVAGVGPKGAADLLNQYENLEGIYDHIDQIKGKRRENLERDQEKAFLSRDLATIRCDVPLEIKLEDFHPKAPNIKALKELCTELGFTKLLNELGNGVPSEKKQSLSRSRYYLLDSVGQWKLFKSRVIKEKIFAFDTETNSLNPMEADLVGISFSFANGEAYYFPRAHSESVQLKWDEIKEDLKEIFADTQVKKIAQNFKYDAHVLLNQGIEVKNLKFDTMIASFLLDPAEPHSLDKMAEKYLDHHNISYESLTGKGKTQISFAEVPLTEAKDYACEDADVTFRLYEILNKKIEEEDLLKAFSEMEIPLCGLLLKMERQGIALDVQFLQDLQKSYEEQLVQYEKEIYQLAGSEFNINSPKQLGKILFEDLGLPIVKKTKTGPSTDVNVLTELSYQHELPKKILDYRALAKLNSTYVIALQEKINPHTKRVHTSFNQTIAETGRLSSTEPNLQNIPIRSEEGRKIRQAFVAKENCVLLSSDYSQVELRILAHMSNDGILIRAYQENQDIHALTAAELFQVDVSEVDREQRAIGKTVNFGVIYGQTPYGLANQMQISQSEAKHYIDTYFAHYPRVLQFKEEILEGVRKTGKAETILGRRRYVRDINHKNRNIREMNERFAFNTVIQGSAADIMKLAMLKLQSSLEKNRLESQILLQVHDELLLEVPILEKDKLLPIVKDAMMNAYPLKIPLVVDMRSGKNWDEAH